MHDYVVAYADLLLYVFLLLALTNPCHLLAILQIILCSVWNEIITNCVELASYNAQDIRRQLTFAGVDFIDGLAAFPDSVTT